jgi:sugar O-acyltransferase (sialic acid O-acetyltransferase NeuD family)
MSDAPVILVGAGGHARVLLDALSLSGKAILGLVDANPALIGRKILGFEVLGGDEALRRHAPGTIRLVNAIGSASSMERRRSVYEAWRRAGHSFASVQHPGAIVSRHAIAAAGVQVMAGAVVQASAIIGENTIVNTGATVDHDCDVGAHVHLAPGVTLSGNVQVGDSTHVGAGATVIQGVRIGARCTIAAGAVVLSDVADGTTVAGVPAKEVRK